MVAPSKIFYEPLTYYHCSQLFVHPNVGCFRYFFRNLLNHSLGGLKYFMPLLITPLVLKYKFMNREIFYHALKHYLQTVFCSTLATAFIFLFVCLFRNALGNFRTYTAVFAPTVLGLQFSFFFPPRVTKLFTTATTQATLEGLLLQNSNKLTELILHSTSVQTLLFMLNSAIILHYKSKNIYKEFWFIETIQKFNETSTTTTPNQEILNQSEVPKEKNKTSCYHKNVSCIKFVLYGMKSYLFYGIPLDLINMFMKNNSKPGPKNLVARVGGKLRGFRPFMTAFFLSYVGVYRMSSCLMRKYYSNLSLDLQHILSAFLGGFSFVFVKRRNFVLLSLVISVQLLWQQFCSSMRAAKTGRKRNLMLMLLNHVPISQIILSLNCGYLAHNYLFNHHLINSLAKNLLDGLTSNELKKIRYNLINSDMDSLIEMRKPGPIKMFL